MKYRIIKHGVNNVYYTAEWLDGDDWRILINADLGYILQPNNEITFHNKKEAIESIKRFLTKMKQKKEDLASEPKIVADGKI